MQARDIWHDGEVTNHATGKTYKGIAAHREQLAGAFRALASNLGQWSEGIKAELTDGAKVGLVEDPEGPLNLESLRTVNADELTSKLAMNELFKRGEDAVTFADKVLRPPKDKTFKKADIHGAFKRLVEEREDALFVLERIAYFEKQFAWLDTNFPDSMWLDVEGLCRVASRAEIAEQGFSLNSGRYVGVSSEVDGMSEADFRALMEKNADELANLHTQAGELQELIAEDFKGLFCGS